MALRTGHGTGAGVPRVEVLPPRRTAGWCAGGCRRGQPDGRHGGGPVRPRQPPQRARGPSQARDLASDGPAGALHAARRRCVRALPRVRCHLPPRPVRRGSPAPSEVARVAPGRRASWPRPPSPWPGRATLFSDRAATTGDPELAMRSARLGETSRQHLLAAHELCAREAAARPRKPADAQAELRRRIPRGGQPVHDAACSIPRLR